MLTVQELRAVVYRGVMLDSTGDDDGPFGPIFAGFTNRPEDSIKKLMTERRGEIVDAFIHSEIGRIAFVYGNEDYGLRHIEARRGMAWVNKIPGILRTGKVERDKSGLPRVYLIESTSQRSSVMVIRLDWDGKQRTWLMTVFPDDKGRWSGADKTSRTVGQQGLVQGNPSQSNSPHGNGSTSSKKIKGKSANVPKGSSAALDECSGRIQLPRTTLAPPFCGLTYGNASRLRTALLRLI